MTDSVTQSLWTSTVAINHFPQLTADAGAFDTVIIGGGLTGMLTAWRLKQAGKKVVVIEMNRLGLGETGHTSAHLTEVFDTPYAELISAFGLDGARLAAESMRTSVNDIGRLIQTLGLDCHLRAVMGYQYAETEHDLSFLDEQSEAALQLGVATTRVSDVPLPFETKGALRFERQAQLNPLELVKGLALKIQGEGSLIFEDSRVLEVEDGDECRVHTDRGSISCREVVVAANVPVLNRFLLQTKIAAYRTYALAADWPAEVQLDGLFWSVKDPYHYIRSYSEGNANYLVVGGEDHKVGDSASAQDAFRKLRAYAKEKLFISDPSFQWSGQIIETVDGLPFIGRNPMSDNIFVATGYSGTGLTYAGVAARLISDLILGNDSNVAALYDPSRIKPIASALNFVKENASFPAHMIGDRLSPADDSDLAHLRENEGRMIRVGAKKVAAYRDTSGDLHLLSPICPHMGCYVGWNDAEKSWDCPCHGSRFSAKGQLLNGPATTDLAPEQTDDNGQRRPLRYEDTLAETSSGSLFEPSPLLGNFTCPCRVSQT